jgi:hypothetical protein
MVDKKTFNEYVVGLDKERENILGVRGSNYSVSPDVLANFKDVSTIWNVLHPGRMLGAEDVAEVLSILKMVRLSSLMYQGKGFDDPVVKDTIIDGHNYLDLRVGCIIDRTQKA